MTERTCNGGCCAVFFLFDEIANGTQESTDSAFIKDMVIPLTRPQALSRYRRLVGGEPPWKGKRLPRDQGTYTCRHWDTETKLCGVYEDRPEMCRNYPYGRACTNVAGCTYQVPEPEAMEQRYFKHGTA